MKKLDKTKILEKFHKFVYDHNLILESVGSDLELHPSTVARILNWETSNPQPRTLYRIKKYLEENGVKLNS